ncbi:MAG: MlaD family protein [Solirubrobacteraceae bacterium]
MQKQAPTLGRVGVLGIFALSCLGLLTFLWLSFGGAIPLEAKGYRFKAAFPQAIQLAVQADVRISGISVGKVAATAVDKADNRTTATIELNSRYAPLHTDARAILRQKTLLGETYVELAPGTPGSPTIKEGSWLANAQVADAQTLDQVISAFDKPTRAAFQTWQQSLAQGSQGYGQNLNDAIGNLPSFVTSAGDLLAVLNSQSSAVGLLVKNTGVTFNAIGQNTQQLRNLITGSSQTFAATASEASALSQTFKLFPNFLDQTKVTLLRLQKFALNTDPLLRNLSPAVRDLGPTLRQLKLLAPDLEATFRKLDPLIVASRTGLPALTQILQGAKPLLGNLDPFLEQLNPILQWLEYNQGATSDFISNPPAGVTNVIPQPPGSQEVGHFLRQYGPVGIESLAFQPTRSANNRGNAYVNGVNLAPTPTSAPYHIFPNFDCKPSGGPRLPDFGAGIVGCLVQPPANFQGNTLAFPHVGAANYGP